MNRRTFIKGTAIGSATLIGGGTLWLRATAAQTELTVSNVLAYINKMEASTFSTTGQWNAIQVFHHLAQSVEYSMQGYPEHKPEWFKHSLGSIAFSVFSTRKQMSHTLNEAIPGAPELPNSGELSSAIQRFKISLTDFSEYTGQLEEHFAFGKLNKADYEKAHAMHFFNHLDEFAVG